MPHPNRIISLVPSQTELLYDLGLNKEVIGITKFCVHPNEWFRTKARVGGTKTANLEKIKSLHPDLVIANKEENVKEQIEEISKFAPMHVSDIATFDDALEMIKQVGTIVGKEEKAVEIISRIQLGFEQLAEFTRLENCKSGSLSKTPFKVAYLIWKDPLMTVGADTFIHDLLGKCGFSNAFQHLKRYPQVSVDELKAAELDYIILSSEPYPFKQKDIDELQRELPQVKIILADGEMFSWYGSRMIKAASYFQQLIQREFGRDL